MLDSRWTLRSRLPELVRQELWGILMAYNLVRYQGVMMATHLKGDYLSCQLSFSGAISEISCLDDLTRGFAKNGTRRVENAV